MRPSVVKFKTTPIRAMSTIRIRPDENTIALGGVAMGNMKAPLDAKATGAAKYKGFTPCPVPMPRPQEPEVRSTPNCS